MPADTATAVPSTAPQQQRPQPACHDDGYAVPSAATSTSYRPAVHVDPSALGIADFVANAELSRTTSTQLPPSGTGGGKTTRTAVAVETDEFAEFHPFSPSGTLPHLSPCLNNADSWGSDSSGDGGKRQRQQRRRHRHVSTDSFTPTSPDDTESSSGSNSAQQPSPHAIATAFTPIWKGGKIEHTKELMERVALVKAQFRARQLAAATGQCQEQRE
jgi:hypothetical protein